MCICEMSLVDTRRVVGREGVGDEEAECGLHDEDLGVRTQENICIGAVCFDRLR